MFRASGRMKASQDGFSLIEVLIAVLILAIGLLGLAGLQVTSLQSTNEANQQALATLHATTIAESYRVEGGWDEDALTGLIQRDLGEEAQVSVSEEGNRVDIAIRWPARGDDEDDHQLVMSSVRQ